MEPEKRPVSRRKVNKKTYKKVEKRNSVAKGFWVSFKVLVRTVFIVTIVTLCVISGLLLGIIAGCIITTEPLTKEDLDITNSTALTSFVYDSQGNELVSIKGPIPSDKSVLDVFIDGRDDRLVEVDGRFYFIYD